MMTNEKVNNYKNALVEVEAVLNCLNYEAYKKIPPDVIEAISDNKNEDYEFEYDEELDYKDWNLMPETKALLYNILKNYIATEEQKQYFFEKEKLERIQLEKEKLQNYNPDNIFKNNKNIVEEDNVEQESMVIYKENIFRKIFNRIKKLFKSL